MTFTDMFAAKDRQFADTVAKTGVKLYKSWLLFKDQDDESAELPLDRDMDRFALTAEAAVMTAIRNHKMGEDEAFNHIFNDKAEGLLVVMSMELPAKFMGEDIITTIDEDGEEVAAPVDPEYNVADDTFYATTRGRVENPHTVQYNTRLIEMTPDESGHVNISLPTDAVVKVA